MASTAELSGRDLVIVFKVKIATRQDQSFKQIRQKDCNIVGSRQQEVKKHKK